MGQRGDSSTICSRCNITIFDDDPVVRDHGETYHVRCATGAAREPAAVLCVVCRTGIGSVGELVLAGAGAMHTRCQRAQEVQRAS
jgi:hypothetical protein